MMDAKLLRDGPSSKQETVLSFLGIEVVALVCFGFAGATGLTLLRAVGVCIALFLYPLAKNRLAIGSITKKDLYFMIPALLLPFFLGFSAFQFAINSGSVLSPLLDGLLVSLGLIGMAALGLFLNTLNAKTRKYALYGVLGGLALVVLITMLYWLYCYGPFYAVIHSGEVYYYDGVVFPIATEGKYLDGFAFVDVEMYFAKTISFALSCSGAGLFALLFKKMDKRDIIVVSVCSGIGILDIVLTPFIRGIILLVLIYLIAFAVAMFMKLRRKDETAAKAVDLAAKIIFFVLIGIVATGCLLLFIDAYLIGNGEGILRKIPLIGAYFEPGGTMYTLETAISQLMFNSDAAGRRSFDFVSLLFGAKDPIAYDLRMFEFQVLYQNGLLAFLLLLYAAFFGMLKGYRLLSSDEGKEAIPYAYCFIALGVFVYLSFCDSEMPLRHPSDLNGIFSSHSSSLLQFTRGVPCMLLAYCLGAIYRPESYKQTAEEKLAAKNYEYEEVNVNE